MGMNRLSSLALVVAFAVPMLAWPLPQAPANAAGEAQVFRDAFTLKLRLNSNDNYQKQFDKVPYVDGGDVYLFVGEKFGVNVTVSGDEITGLTYVPNWDQADVGFEFSEPVVKGGKTPGATMTLIIHNKLKRQLFIDALMTLPQKDGINNTDIAPIRAGMGDFDMWQQPIVQLVLRNFRFAQQPSGPNERRTDPPRYMSPVTTH
jgi:hypothetical protein